MHFRRAFERNVNRNMAEDDAQSHTDHSSEAEEGNLKKAHEAKEEAEEDIELSEKKDRPPRFSTIFENKPVPEPQIIERYIEQPAKKRAGVYLPTPLFVVLAFILFFESTLLFAYTSIGLYNNLPQNLIPFGPSSNTVVGGCDCSTAQPAINVAPKFFMGSPQPLPSAPSTAKETSSAPFLPDILSVTTSTKTQSTSSKSTTKIPIVTVTPTPSPPKSTVIETEVSTAPRSTTTSFATVQSTVGENKKRGSVKTAEAGQETAKATKVDGGDGGASPTTEADAATSSDGGGMGCFGGAGAVGLVCPSGVGTEGNN